LNPMSRRDFVFVDLYDGSFDRCRHRRLDDGRRDRRHLKKSRSGRLLSLHAEGSFFGVKGAHRHIGQKSNVACRGRYTPTVGKHRLSRLVVGHYWLGTHFQDMTAGQTFDVTGQGLGRRSARRQPGDNATAYQSGATSSPAET